MSNVKTVESTMTRERVEGNRRGQGETLNPGHDGAILSRYPYCGE